MAKLRVLNYGWVALAVLACGSSARGQIREYLASPAGQAESAASREILEYFVRQTEALDTAAPGRYCGTSLGQYYFDHQRELGPRARAAVAAAWPGLAARPVLDSSFDVPGVPIRIHYNIVGPDSVRNATSDTAADGVPTYVHVAAESLRKAYELLIDTMAFAPPVGDGAAGGGVDLYDCYLARPGGQIFVIAFTAAETGYNRIIGNDTILFASSYQVVHPTMEPFPQLANRLDLLRITCAHEFFHAIHFNLDVDEKPFWQVNGWWLEGTAVWFEDRSYPDINDWANLPPYLSRPERSIMRSTLASDLHPYGGGSLWTFYLAERFGGDQMVRAIWERCGQSAGDNTLDATSAELLSRNAVLDSAWYEFANWCMKTGGRDDGTGFQQAAEWPEVSFRDSIGLRRLFRYPSTVHFTDGSDSLAVGVSGVQVVSDQMFRLEALAFSPALALIPIPTLSGQFGLGAYAEPARPVGFFAFARDTLSDPDLVEFVDLSANAMTTLTNWPIYDTVFVVAASAPHFDTAGGAIGGFSPFLVSVSDTGITLFSEVTTQPPFPNPVSFDSGEFVHLRLVLARPMDVYLDIFTMAGDRVRSFALLQSVNVVNIDWDGTNESGRKVAAGLYLCKLTAGTTEQIFRVGVVR